MTPISVNDNFVYFKNGMLNAIKLFKTLYEDNKNIFYYSNNKLYVNNLEQLLSVQGSFPFAYKFGEEFVINNIKNFRDNICVNPILYILSLEILITNCKDLHDIIKYKDKFLKVSLFLKKFYNESHFPKVKLTATDLKSVFGKYVDDNFLNTIIKTLVENDYNIEILESKENKITVDNYYRLKSSMINGRPFEYTCRVFITNELNKNLYVKLAGLNFPILVICSSYDENINFYSTNIRVIKISQTLMIQRYNDLCLLSGFGKGYYNLDENEFNEYSFGKLKFYKFIDGVLYLQFFKYFDKQSKHISYLNKKETLDRYYMLQGYNLTIHTTEEYMEVVRHIVTIIKSLKFSGAFYNEISTLDLIDYNFSNVEGDSIIHDFIFALKDAFMKSLSMTKKDLLNKKNLKSFWILDYYLNTFMLLDSNINVLYKIY